MVWISRLFLAEGNGSEYRAAILEHLNLIAPAGRRQHIFGHKVVRYAGNSYPSRS